MKLLKLSSMELDILDMLVNGRTHWSGTGTEIIWGAAMSELIENLHSMRLVTYPEVTATEAGKAALEEQRPNSAAIETVVHRSPYQ